MQLLYRLLKKPFFGRYMLPWRNPLSEAETAIWQKATLPSKSGGQICTWYREAENAKATIILGHPMGKPAKGEYLKTAYPTALLAAGCNVVLFDFNGFGESSMGNFDFHYDLLAVRDFVQQKLQKPLAYHGISFGCNWGSVALAQPDNPIRIALLESGPVNLLEFWVQYPNAFKALKLMFNFAPHYRRYSNFEEHMKHTVNCDKVLFLYSDTDKFTPYSFGERFEAASNVPNTTLQQLHNADHAMAIHQQQESYIERAVGFFNSYFAQPTEGAGAA